MTKNNRPAVVEPILIETYLAVIQNSVGTNTYRNFYAEINGVRQDILEDGNLSCAYFVAGVLLLFGLLQTGHTTVLGLVKDLEQSKWRLIKEPKLGCIIVWAEKSDNRNQPHKHIGFYTNQDEAISNNSFKRTPQKHHWTFGTKDSPEYRAIEAMYWNNELD